MIRVHLAPHDSTKFSDRDRLLTDLNNHPEDRFAHAALGRHVEVRDRTCSHIGCRRPARRCDLDHTHDHAHGGATVKTNLGPDCGRHHLYKHQLGWQVAQPEPGVFVWTSPLRQVYRTRGEPIALPVSEPLPRPDQPPDPPDSTRRWWHGPTLRLPDPPPPPNPDPHHRTPTNPHPAECALYVNRGPVRVLPHRLARSRVGRPTRATTARRRFWIRSVVRSGSGHRDGAPR